MADLIRLLRVFADGHLVTGFRHARLTGRDALGLTPMPFALNLWNLVSSDYYLLSSAKKISVMNGDSILAAGDIFGVNKQAFNDGIVTEVIFSAGMNLWNTPISLTVDASSRVSETLADILEASGTGISLLSYLGEDPVRSRHQSFYGTAAECLRIALSATTSKLCLVPSGLYVVPDKGIPVSMWLSNDDLIDLPVKINDYVILRTTVTGWSLGKLVELRRNGETIRGLITERSVDADNMNGSWECQLKIQLRDS